MTIFGTPAIVGTSGDDNLVGTGSDDIFEVSQGGNDVVRGLGGNDSFNFGDTFTRADRVVGGAGFDGLFLSGNYDITFSAQSMTGVEIIYLDDPFSYRLLFNDGNIAAGQRLIIDAGNLDGDNSVTLSGVFETDGSFDIGGSSNADAIGTGSGDDIVNAGGGDDIVDPGHGTDVVDAGAGSDLIVFQFGGFDINDRIDGGDTTEQNTLILSGDFSAGFAFKPHTIANITQLILNGGNSYTFDLAHATLRDGSVFVVDGSSLGTADSLHVDGSRVDNASFAFAGGAGADLLLGGLLSDVLNGGAGRDALDGGGGGDGYQFTLVSDSTGKNYDTVVGFDALTDFFFPVFTTIIGNVAAVDSKVGHGSLSTATFNSDLAAAVGAGELGIDHAVLFKPDAGTLADKLFLIVEGNGVAGYQANHDLVVLLDSARHMTQFSEDNFHGVG